MQGLGGSIPIPADKSCTGNDSDHHRWHKPSNTRIPNKVAKDRENHADKSSNIADKNRYEGKHQRNRSLYGALAQTEVEKHGDADAEKVAENQQDAKQEVNPRTNVHVALWVEQIAQSGNCDACAQTA